ncbi:LuxR family transcriptional regulator [Bradyrhizobium sp. AUGA SZCCT0431]|uniref:helix-turn-helix transcriptional regulator n=1 Tax=Bradyrhizobium sp. AUGA SZCCT0431 TaxID=2807674 RepID=UPI001BAA3F1C|nr:LuxR family transcriptional regulator [Bradyrhizobium sp. AUGA SZCCT0431]MBR1146153.1 LuxR family transcriptional regulator [Bradyrhizobium sp. AUGA SZCCT0431]
MHRVFQKFIDLLSSAEDTKAFSETMAETAAALDLSCFAYLALPHQLDNEPLVISTYPANWAARYLHNRYERLDPVVIRALQNPEPFQWGSGLSTKSISRAQQEILDEASQFGIRFGFTVPIHDGHGPIAALTFATDQRRSQFENCTNSHARVLQLMAMYFHAHVRRKLARDRRIGGVVLSPRELECLEWAAQGKTTWEIGRILGISRHTVAFYLENAKAKFGVRTIVQAAARLAASGRLRDNCVKTLSSTYPKG